MSSEVELTFSGDAKGAVRAMDAVGDGAKDMARDLDGAADKGRRFSRSADEISDGLGNSASKFRDTNDLVSGFADTVGLALPPQAQLLMGFADMADGLGGLLAPALAKTKTAMQFLNATMRANPFLTVVTVLTLLVGAFVVAYKKSETFRNIVDGVLKHVKNAFKFAIGAIKGYFESLTGVYRSVFNGIASAWNNTIGRLSFSVPGWVPGIGGAGFDVPDIPTFANGGRFNGGPMIVGERGPELMVPDGAGTIVPNNQLRGGGGDQVVTLRIEGADREFVNFMKRITRLEGAGNVQEAFGR